MNYEEFKNEFVDALQEHLSESGNEVTISINNVEKMNESYEAITITPAGSNIGICEGADWTESGCIQFACRRNRS